jgi:hypothetical protein
MPSRGCGVAVVEVVLDAVELRGGDGGEVEAAVGELRGLGPVEA